MGKGQRVVPESILKKTKRDQQLAEARKQAKAQAKKDRAEQRKVAAEHAAKYREEYQKADRELIDQKRAAKKAGNIFVEEEARLAIVIRTRGINKLSPKCKKIMQLLRLRQLHNAVLVKLNKATMNMIRKVEPFVTYGYPTRKTIKDLVYKRGHGKVNGARIPLTDASIIHESLGKHGISCHEDLIHELVTVGPNFKQANNFLWPYKLSSPLKGFAKKRHSFANGGVFGNRERLINNLVKRMI